MPVSERQASWTKRPQPVSTARFPGNEGEHIGQLNYSTAINFGANGMAERR